MSILPILPIDDPHLTNKTFPVDIENDSEMHRVRVLISDMFETCAAKRGAGLGANQVGSHDRVFIMDLQAHGFPPMAFINPHIVARSEQTQERDEGCLSMPGIFIPVTRHACVKVSFYDVSGAAREYEAVGYAAICCQHEIDHLDGIRFIDYASPMKQMLMYNRWEKLKRQGKA